MKKRIATAQAPAAIGPYSQALRVGDWLYASGQIGLDPASGELVAGGVEAECRQVLANLRAVVVAASFEFRDVVKTTIYLTDLADFPKVNAIYAEAFADPYPARATVGVASLPKGACVEIDFIAYSMRASTSTR